MISDELTLIYNMEYSGICYTEKHISIKPTADERLGNLDQRTKCLKQVKPADRQTIQSVSFSALSDKSSHGYVRLTMRRGLDSSY